MKTHELPIPSESVRGRARAHTIMHARTRSMHSIGWTIWPIRTGSGHVINGRMVGSVLLVLFGLKLMWLYQMSFLCVRKHHQFRVDQTIFILFSIVCNNLSLAKRNWAAIALSLYMKMEKLVWENKGTNMCCPDYARTPLPSSPIFRFSFFFSTN